MKMLSLFHFFFYVSGIVSSIGEANSEQLCVLPPQPKNGHYRILQPKTPGLCPGDKLPNFALEVKCDPGFFNTVSNIFSCSDHGTTFGELECLPQCKRVKVEVISCGVSGGEEVRCLAPPSEPLRDDVIATSTFADQEICGIPAFVARPVLAGGRIAVSHEIPWHAGIYSKTKSPYMQICGGSLVSETVIISAAHCFWSETKKQLPARNYAVAVGKQYRPWDDDIDTNAQKSDVTEIKIPPHFQGSATNLQDDIALVIVSTPIKFTRGVRPVCLSFNVEVDRNQLQPGNLGQVAGWGLTSDDGPASPILNIVEMPVVAIKQCFDKSDPSFKAHITSDKICAGYQNGTAVCKGDSGGGLSFQERGPGTGARYFLRGVVSGAPGSDHLCNTLSWATFTHVLKHHHFIRETNMYSYELPKRTRKTAYVKLIATVATLGRDFCLETSMHGFKHVAEPRRHWIERLLWVCATALAIWGAVHVSLGQLQRYNESPTVVTLDKDFRSWQFSLPAITACHKNRTDPSKLEEVIQDTWNVALSDDRYEYYSRFVRAVTDSTILALHLYEEFAADDSLDVDLFQLTVDVMPDVEIKTTIENKNVFMKWTPVMTEFGACYSINSLAVADTALIKLHPNDTIQYPLTCKYGGTSSCHVMLQDNEHYDIYYQSPYDILDITTPAVYVYPGYVRTVELSVMETTCGRGVKELTPARRACLFNDEPVGNRKVYSTNACRQSCRSKLALELCKCVPFYYFYEEGPACSPSGMACLSQYAHNLTSTGGKKCSCSTQCLYSVFREVTYSDQFWDRGPWSTQGSVKYIVQPPKIRYTREIVFHFQDLVVSFGGAAGLFLGASFISFVEVIYFLLEWLLGPASVQTSQPSPDKKNERKSTYEEQRVKELTAILNHGTNMDRIQ